MYFLHMFPHPFKIVATNLPPLDPLTGQGISKRRIFFFGGGGGK